MGVFNDDLQNAFETLKQRRDELKVQVGLGKLEARDRWQDLEKEWSRLEGKMKLLRSSSEDSLDDVRTDAQVLIDDLRQGFDELRKRV